MQQNKESFFDTNHDVDAAISIPLGRVVCVEVNENNPNKFDGFHLQFTKPSYVAVGIKKTENSTLYIIIHANETIIADDIRREFSFHKEPYERLFIFNESDRNSNLRKYIENEFASDYAINLKIEKPHFYMPFIRVDYFSQQAVQGKNKGKDKYSLIELSTPDKGCTKKLPNNLITEFAVLPTKEQLEIYNHPQGMKLFTCDNLCKIFPTAKELEKRSKNLVIYKNGYWVPLDDKLDIPEEALLLYNNYVSETTNLKEICDNVRNVFNKNSKKHDARFLAALLLGYKYNYDIYLMIHESIQTVLDKLNKRESSLSQEAKSSLNILQEVIDNPNQININKLTTLADSLNKIIAHKERNEMGDKNTQTTIEELTTISYYVATSVNTHLVFQEQCFFDFKEAERRQKVEFAITLAYVFVINNKYTKAIDILKEGASITQRLCLSSDMLPVVYHMELAEKCSTQFKALSPQKRNNAKKLVAPALHAVAVFVNKVVASIDQAASLKSS